jgi:hypothetical protein
MPTIADGVMYGAGRGWTGLPDAVAADVAGSRVLPGDRRGLTRGLEAESPSSFGNKESYPERTGASVKPRRSRAIGYGVRRESPLHNHELTGVGVEGLAVHLDGVHGCSPREVRVELLQV